jgi:hypothetical protein
MAETTRKSSNRGTTDSGEFFSNRSAYFIAALFHAAALAGQPMQWVLRATAGNEKVVKDAIDILNDDISPDASLAADTLQGIVDQDPRTKTAIYATAEVALSVYRLPGALRTTEDPNFSPAEFVAGNYRTNVHRSIWMNERTPPDVVRQMEDFQEWGSYDTVYITASGSQQSLVAPLVAGLLTQIREAVYEQHRADEANGYYDRLPSSGRSTNWPRFPCSTYPRRSASRADKGCSSLHVFRTWAWSSASGRHTLRRS